jgi:hypothetical protein
LNNAGVPVKRIKRAALRLARYFRNLGYRVKIRQRKSGAGVYCTVEIFGNKDTRAWLRRTNLWRVNGQILGRDQSD